MEREPSASIKVEISKLKRIQGLKRNKKKRKDKGPFNKKKKNIVKVKCFNCDNKEYFARDCIEPKKVEGLLILVSVVNVFSSILLTESNPFWNVDSGATDHLAKDLNALVESDDVLKRQDGFMLKTT